MTCDSGCEQGQTFPPAEHVGCNTDWFTSALI